MVALWGWEGVARGRGIGYLDPAGGRGAGEAGGGLGRSGGIKTGAQ